MPTTASDPGTASPAVRVRGLPLQLTRLIGRDREIEEVGRLLATTRLLTLTGAGGSGKTRLAAEVAARQATFAHGAVWVELAPLSDPDLLPQQVLTAIGAGEDPGRTDAETLVQALHDRSQLLVLDNCEHLVDACAALVETLLRRCSGVTILTTSREALGIGGERAWLVPSLSLPEPEPSAIAACRSDAVRLFTERAQAALPSFELTDDNAGAVAQICRRLDGLPLAIELAAARIKLLPPDQIARRLDDAFRLLTTGGRNVVARHRTLRETIDWSHALLSAAEQTLLRRLAVFVGSFSLAAAEAICAGDGIAAGEVLDLLAALVDKSLVLRQAPIEESRYRLLETVRQYGQERLQEAGEVASLRRRHAEYFLAFVENAEPLVLGNVRDPAELERLAHDSGNLRAVAEWSGEAPERVETALRMGAVMHWYWFGRGLLHEGRHRLATALERGAKASPSIRARALTSFGHMTLWQGDPEAGLAQAREAVALLRGMNEPQPLAYALVVLAALTGMAGDPAAAQPLFDEAIAMCRRLGQRTLEDIAFYWRGIEAQACGDYELARSSFEASIAISRDLGYGTSVAHGLTRLGRLEVALGAWEEAARCLSEALALHHQVEDRWGAALVLEGLAQVAAREERLERAARLLAAATALRDWIGATLTPADREAHDKLLAALRAALGAGVFAGEWETGHGMTLDQAVACALERTAPPAEEVPQERRLEPVASLQVVTLGHLRITQGERILDDAVWSSARAKELFLWLLCHPEGGSKEEAGLALWPDSSPENLRNTFHVTLHRLRKALGEADWIVHEANRYRINPALDLEYDAAEFESATAASLRSLAAGQDALAELQEALALYRGDFLANESVGEWCEEIRGRMRQLYLDGLLGCGDALMIRQRYSDAAEVLRRLLAHDETHEGACRRLMICLTRQGERSQALRQYKRLAEAVRRELDSAPEDETTDLYERLQNAEAV